MANSHGGHLVLGVQETEEVATELRGIEGLDLDAELVRMEQILRSGLEPTVSGTLKGSDLSGGQDKLFLRGDGLVGVPDALFVHRDNAEIIIGEAKSRYHRGVITDYERCQITLYMGVTGGNTGRRVRGLLRYGCGTVVPIAFDVDLYHQLFSQVPACRAALSYERAGT